METVAGDTNDVQHKLKTQDSRFSRVSWRLGVSLIVDFKFLGQNRKMTFLSGPSEKINFSNFTLLLLAHYIVDLHKIDAHNNI